MLKLFENSGNQLFKYRGQIPLVLFCVAIPVIYFDKNQSFFLNHLGKSPQLILAILFIVFGHLIRFLVIGYKDVHTSGKNRDQQVANSLNTSGMYSIVRHPLYLGNFLIWMGLLIWFGNACFLLLSGFFFYLIYREIIRVENQFLASQFGESYTSWSSKTPSFFPLKGFANIKQPTTLFSMKMIWKNEYPGIVSSLSSFWFISLMRLMFTEEKLTISTPLLVFALSIALFGFGSRYLKHKTNFFPKMG